MATLQVMATTLEKAEEQLLEESSGISIAASRANEEGKNVHTEKNIITGKTWTAITAAPPPHPNLVLAECTQVTHRCEKCIMGQIYWQLLV